MSAAQLQAEYHRLERQWVLWDGRSAVLDEAGEVRLFLTAEAAYEWLAKQHTKPTHKTPRSEA